MSLPWFKCYPRDFNDGMMGLTLEERGAYITILNCIYMRGGPVADDPSYWRAMLQCGGKTWSKVRASLVFKRRVFEVVLNGEPCLMNHRAAEEIAQVEAQRKILSERGAKGGRISQAKSKENNNIGQAPARQGLKPGSSDIDTDTEYKKDTPTEYPKKGCRLPPDWKPSEDDLAFAHSKLSPKDVADAADRFRDHWVSQPGSKGVKLDWPATWRNWVRNTRPSANPFAQPKASGNGSKPASMAGILAERRRQAGNANDVPDDGWILRQGDGV